MIVDEAISIHIPLCKDLVQLFICKCQSLSDKIFLHLSLRDQSISIFVSLLEFLKESCLRPLISGHSTQEFLEVDTSIPISVLLFNHIIELCLGGGQAKLFQNGCEILGGEGAFALLVKLREGLFVLIDLVRGEIFFHIIR